MTEAYGGQTGCRDIAAPAPQRADADEPRGRKLETVRIENS
jgi:hypothetical protein